MIRLVPGALRRLARQPLRVVAVVLLAGVALAASGIQSAAATALQSTLDANWRGAYDILVTPRDGMHAVNGMLPPNTLNSTFSGLTLDDLKKVRAVAGVDVAAPLGEMLLPNLAAGTVSMSVPHGLAGTDTEPQTYRLSATYTSDDGLGERIVWHGTQTFIVDETHPADAREDGAQCGEDPDGTSSIDGRTYRESDYPALTTYLCQQLSPVLNGVTGFLPGPNGDTRLRYSGYDGQYSIALPVGTLSTTRITLVDPVAEQKLLGKDGAFLSPLVDLDPSADTDVRGVATWAQSASSDFARDARTTLGGMASGLFDAPADVLPELRQIWKANGDDWDEWVAHDISNTAAVPLLVSNAPTANLSVKVDISAFGPASKVEGGDGVLEYGPSAAVTQKKGTTVGSTSADASEVLNPFLRVQTDTVAWPGTELDDVVGGYGALEIQAAGRDAATGYTVTPQGITLAVTGYRSPLHGSDQNSFGENEDPNAIGSEAAYQLLDETWTFGNSDGLPAMAVPVGSFDPRSIGGSESVAGSVPLGAYSDVSSTVTAGPHAGSTLRPAVSGTGLVGTRTVAIASIASAAAWHDDAPIDAVRVRVAGISAYDAGARQKVIDVATAIQNLGFQATVVAGSSPTQVGVDVTGYAFGTMDPNGTQTVGDLGTVVQRWSELGAAARVDLSVSTATYAMLGIGLVAVLLLMGTVQLAAIPGRRLQARAMRDIGFTRARIARWYAAEEVPGWLIVALVGGAAVALAADRLLAAVVVGVALVIIAVVGAISVIAGSRARVGTRPRGSASRRMGAASIIGFGARQARIHPLSSVVHTVAIVVVGVACAGLVAVALNARSEAGASLLAGLTWVRMLWPQLALGLAGIGGGLLLARLVRRIDLDRRAAQWRVLRAAGWTTGQLAAAQRTEGIVVALPAIALAALVAWGGAIALGFEPTWISAAAAGGAGIVCSLLTFTARGKGRDT
ncbi:hypothetical protein PU630_00160 [Microbacterium horticulturae]|uniref:FtsX-like permease family protein n=1 Tax=Microbacterium horticulturae TaxID=3028316 RepID=A0ABY8BXT7_9MICO|nr:hypothetical protein [Microbacterium sp. KACC 23027]WEG09011.1 hypothetical protein PU630_00160 [Microbacterium sp. KACC 23027]